MCILLIAFQTLPGAPVLVAANREERYDRPADPPRAHAGTPPVLCGTDRTAGGTWLGVNAHGVLVAVTNRPRPVPTAGAPSRGRLCRELLECGSAPEAAARALDRLAEGRYAGANFACLDAMRGVVVHGGATVTTVDIDPGWHAIANGDLDDPHDERLRLARGLVTAPPIVTVEAFIERTAEVCAHSGVLVRQPDRGTVSSEQIVLTASGAAAVYRYAPGPPDERPYVDLSPMLRALLAPARPTTGHDGS